MKLTKQRLTQIIKEELENLSEEEGSMGFEKEDDLTGLGKYKTDPDKLSPEAKAVFDKLPEEAKSKAVFKNTNKFWDIVVTGETGSWNYSKFNFKDGKYQLHAPQSKRHGNWIDYEISDPEEVAEIIADRIW
jgi:hypothetical protein